MKVQQLIDALEELDSPEAEVRFASQPTWPFEYSIDTLTYVDSNDKNLPECGGICDECPEHDDCEESPGDDESEDDESEDDDITVYLVEGRQIGYLPSAARRMIGW